MSYAKNTEVTEDRSQQEIQNLLKKYGAAKFAMDWETNRILFEIHNRKIQLQLTMPKLEDFEYTPTHIHRNQTNRQQAWQQAKRQRWRALVLIIKAKLEAIEAGITTIDHEFLPDFLLQNGQTVSETILPQLKHQPEILPLLPE